MDCRATDRSRRIAEAEVQVKRPSQIAIGALCLLLFGRPSEASWLVRDDRLVELSGSVVDIPAEPQVPDQPNPGAGLAPRRPGSARAADQPGAQAPTRPGVPAGAQPTAPPRPPAPSPTMPQPAVSAPPAGTAPPAGPSAPSFARPPADRAELERAIQPDTSILPFSGQAGTFGSLEGFSTSGIPVMIGDLGPTSELRVFKQATGSGGLPGPCPPPKPPGVPGAKGASMVIPAVRGLKISENQSPRPQDRIYFSFNYFQGVNDAVNQKLQAPIGYTQVFRYIGGFEKTFLDGQGSIGIRAPLDSVTATSNVPPRFGNYGGTSTAVGDVGIYAKYILLEDRQSGNLLSGGLAISPPTGPGKFAGFNSFASITHTTTFQPFLGYIYNVNRFYIHGFTAIDVPANSQDVTLLYNDVGFGYFLIRPDPNSALDPLISMVAPTFEVHITDPLNHRGALNPRDPVGMTDIVNLTYGLSIGIYSKTLLTFGIVNPVTSPKPFDFEAMAFLNYFYGGPRRRQVQVPPVVGGF